MGLLADLFRDLRTSDPKRKARTAEDSGALLAGMAGKLRFTDEGPGTLPGAGMLPEWIPLLSAGEGGRQRFPRILRGELGGTANTAGPCALAAFVYQFRINPGNGSWLRWNRGEISCVLVDVELAMREDAFQGLYVQPKGPVMGYSPRRYDYWNLREIETSDARLHTSHNVWVPQREDDERPARRLLADGLGDFLAAYPIVPGFEVAGTRLCTFVEDPLTTEEEVFQLLEAARELAPRVIAAAG